MANTKDFVNSVRKIYNEHGVYIGCGNGEKVEDLTIGQIARMEKAYGGDYRSSVRRVLAYIGKCYENGWDMSKARACDCSGLEVAALREIGAIKPTDDFRARDFQAMSQKVELKDLMAGDLVFNQASGSTHMGTYTGDGYVIESRGRDYGVVNRTLELGKWVCGGRLKFLTPAQVVLDRMLKYKPGAIMSGDDVKAVQEKLAASGFLTDKVDGQFGPNTSKAVIAFQKSAQLEPDGIVGPMTAAALGLKMAL